MNDVHAKINSSNDKEKNLELFIKNISKNIKFFLLMNCIFLILLMLLLIKKFFNFLEHNNIFVMTSSNFKPDSLYKNGLQRADFVPFIEHINDNYDVIRIDSEKDYRRLTLNQSKHILLQ